MRKFLFNTNVLSAAFGAWSIVKTMRSGPRDWRLIALWISWAATMAVAIGTVAIQSKEDELER